MNGGIDMKVFNLNYHDIEYAIVFADNIKEAKKKAEKRTGIPTEEWVGEEFKPGMYEDVLYFC
jgi:hypothetical protein